MNKLTNYNDDMLDPRLGLRNHFLSIELDDRSSTLITMAVCCVGINGGGIRR